MFRVAVGSAVQWGKMPTNFPNSDHRQTTKHGKAFWKEKNPQSAEESREIVPFIGETRAEGGFAGMEKSRSGEKGTSP